MYLILIYNNNIPNHKRHMLKFLAFSLTLLTCINSQQLRLDSSQISYLNLNKQDEKEDKNKKQDILIKQMQVQGTGVKILQLIITKKQEQEEQQSISEEPYERSKDLGQGIGGSQFEGSTNIQPKNTLQILNRNPAKPPHQQTQAPSPKPSYIYTPQIGQQYSIVNQLQNEGKPNTYNNVGMGEVIEVEHLQQERKQEQRQVQIQNQIVEQQQQIGEENEEQEISVADHP